MNKALHLFQFGLLAVAAFGYADSQAVAGEPISSQGLDGEYWAVQHDQVYGEFQHPCRIISTGETAFRFSNYPIAECRDINGTVDVESNQLVVPNGQILDVDDYNRPIYLWSAAPNDPVMNYDTTVDEDIFFNVDTETGIISWDAPLNEAGNEWLRYLMAGKYYFVNGEQKVSGIFHFTKVRLYPTNSRFSCDQYENDFESSKFEQPLRVVMKDNTLQVFGLLNVDHATPIEFIVNKVQKSVSLVSDVMCENHPEMGRVLLMSQEDEEVVRFDLSTEDGQSVITFNNFKASSPETAMTVGHFTNGRLEIPFDVVELATDDPLGVSESGADTLGAVRYYNMQGVELCGPQQGLYIEVRNNVSTKKIGRYN